MDTAWLLRNVGLGKEPMAKLLAEREGIYSLLSQTQPNNLSTAYHAVNVATDYAQYLLLLVLWFCSCLFVCLSRDCHRSCMLSDLLSQAPNTKMLISVYLLGCLLWHKG
jgi:hypothetical protein